MNSKNKHKFALSIAIFFQLFCFASLAFAIEQEKGLTRYTPTEKYSFAQEEKIAVVVGLSDYPERGGLSSLNYADNDANAMGKQLEAMGYKVEVLTNHNATSSAVINVMQDLGQYLEPEKGTFLFYFSGHGFAHEQTNYLATYESSPANIQYTGLALDAVIDQMRDTGAKRQILLVDACRNDPDIVGKSVGGSRSFTQFSEAEGTKILFSTKFGGKSYEYSNLGHGVYTHYLLNGLKGKARQKDGAISFGDLADYVSSNVKKFAYKAKLTQVPFVAGEYNGDFLLHTITKDNPLSTDEMLSSNTFADPIPRPMSQKKNKPWYKNPWFWAGMAIAGGGTAIYLNQDSDSGDRTTRTE